MIAASADRLSDLGGDPFGDDHRREDADEDQRHLRPGQRVERRLQLQADAARADQPEDGGFADVDVPAKDADGQKVGTTWGAIA